MNSNIMNEIITEHTVILNTLKNLYDRRRVALLNVDLATYDAIDTEISKLNTELLWVEEALVKLIKTLEVA